LARCAGVSSPFAAKKKSDASLFDSRVSKKP